MEKQIMDGRAGCRIEARKTNSYHLWEGWLQTWHDRREFTGGSSSVMLGLATTKDDRFYPLKKYWNFETGNKGESSCSELMGKMLGGSKDWTREPKVCIAGTAVNRRGKIHAEKI